jgi:hypothetical protein
MTRVFWAVFLATVVCLHQDVSRARGRLEGGLTVGPDEYLERSLSIEFDVGRYLGVAGLASVADDGETNSTQFYLVAGEVRTPLGVSMGGGYTRSPTADDVKSRSYFGTATVEFPIPEELADFRTTLDFTFEQRTYSLKPGNEWFDLEQTSFEIGVTETLFDRYALSVEYSSYDYDRNLGDLTRRAVDVGTRRRNLNLLNAASYLSALPAWILNFGFYVYPTSKSRVELDYSLIETEVNISGSTESRYAVEAGYLFLETLEVSLGVAAYDSVDGTDLYVSSGLAYVF